MSIQTIHEWREQERKRCRDTSRDDETWQTDRFAFVDAYTLLVFGAMCVPKFIVLFFPLHFLLAIPVSILSINASIQTRCTSRVRHTSGASRVFSIPKPVLLLTFILALPSIALIAINLLVDLFAMTLFGLLYATLSGRIFGSVVKRNFQLLEPFDRRGKTYYSSSSSMSAPRVIEQLSICVSGMLMRQGFFEFMYSFTNMFLINPWVKYWFSANPWLHTLGVRFVTQIGGPIEADTRGHALSLDTVGNRFERSISDSYLSACSEVQGAVDEWFFTPHYPQFFPMSNSVSSKDNVHANQSMGMQHAVHTCALVHTKLRNFNSLSRTCALPMYQVMLWRDNPFHLYTGYVEANVSTERQGVEHPMWLVCGHNDLASNRNRLFASGWIDQYFHDFIPHFSALLRFSAPSIPHNDGASDENVPFNSRA